LGLGLEKQKLKETEEKNKTESSGFLIKIGAFLVGLRSALSPVGTALKSAIHFIRSNLPQNLQQPLSSMDDLSFLMCIIVPTISVPLYVLLWLLQGPDEIRQLTTKLGFVTERFLEIKALRMENAGLKTRLEAAEDSVREADERAKELDEENNKLKEEFDRVVEQFGKDNESILGVPF